MNQLNYEQRNRFSLIGLYCVTVSIHITQTNIMPQNCISVHLIIKKKEIFFVELMICEIPMNEMFSRSIRKNTRIELIFSFTINELFPIYARSIFIFVTPFIYSSLSHTFARISLCFPFRFPLLIYLCFFLTPTPFLLSLLRSFSFTHLAPDFSPPLVLLLLSFVPPSVPLHYPL